ncbi:ATP-binding protein, partial [Faecalibaculum rodentium]
YGSKEGSMNIAQVEAKVKQMEGVLNAVDNTLPSWRDIIEPHPDVARGLYQKAEFAADLAQVARKDPRTAMEYADPVEFFSRTYITNGMRGLLEQALKRVSGRGGEPIIQLKTAFGGGKTHSMLALYHMLRGNLPLKKVPILEPLLKEAGLSALPKANVAVLVGTALDPATAKRPNDFPGITVNTLWGEMAMQLARNANDPSLYNIIKEADKKHVSPGSEKLTELFDQAGPCLILMDELVAYGKKLEGRTDLPAGTFDNFITFIQELTEAAKASKNSMVVASIPESNIEIGGEAGQRTLAAIEHTFGRTESVWNPVEVNEGFEVVRRRLFLDCKDKKKRDEVCEAYSLLYRQEPEHFPYEARSVEYEEQLKACYPIHPEIFNRLFNDWASLEKFQRTRGVLRLMAAVIHALWMGGDGSSMILPGTLPLDEPSVRDELTRYLPEGWNSIVMGEVDGKNSIPYKVDMERERYGKVMAARRVARDIFLGSAPTNSQQSVRGVDRQQIHLGVMQPGESLGTFNDALSRLLTKCAYLNASRADDRFWYDTRPTLLKTANDRKQLFKEADCDVLVEKRLKKLVGTSPVFCKVHLCPQSTADVPDEPRTRLVVLKPNQVWKEGREISPAQKVSQEILDNRGSFPRKYRNMLLFLAPSDRDRDAVLSGAKELLAWQSIKNEKLDLNLDQIQIREVEEKIRELETTLDNRIQACYKVELNPYVDLAEDQREVLWDRNSLHGVTGSIAQHAGETALSSAWVAVELSPVFLQKTLKDFIWKDRTFISVKDLWDFFATYLYVDRVKDFDVLKRCIMDGVQDKNFFGVASDIIDGHFENLKYAKPIRELYMTDLIVEAETAKDQLITDAETPPQPVVSETPPETGSRQEESPKPAEERPRRFFMRQTRFDRSRITRQLGDIVSEILDQLDGIPDDELHITFSIDAYFKDGFTESEQRGLMENCASLGIEDCGLDK